MPIAGEVRETGREIFFSREEEHGWMGKTRKKAPAAKAKKQPARKEKKPEPKLRRRAQKTVVKEIRQNVEDRLAQDVEKASLSDYIRLVQLEKELTQTVAKETRATWVEPKEHDEEDAGEGQESGSEK